MADGPGEAKPAPAKKARRLDERVLYDGLSESRSAAQALILSGRVLVDDVVADKAGVRVSDESVIRLKGGARPFVSRGGEKLASALDDVGFDPAGLDCLDVGASTGGFTDCLLQRGARHITAIDVGHSQMHSRLRLDPRVDVRERINARHMDPGDFDRDFGLFVVDVSFISIKLVLPAIDACAPAAHGLLLVKPQFEVGQKHLGRNGIVRDDKVRSKALERCIAEAEAEGFVCAPPIDSPIEGASGNREFLLHFSWGQAS